MYLNVSGFFQIWDRGTGKPYTSIESENAELNDICAYDGSGLIFMANEQPKMQVHYIPSLGEYEIFSHFFTLNSV